MVNVKKLLKDMKPQSDEFKAVDKLAKAFNALPAIVDDDYPEARHVYESRMRALIDAIRENGRLG